jgi:muramoyltetrapeptide carboxypeptidase LdcA involved in peptidoglycan recycling
MDTPYEVPPPLAHWLDVAGLPPGGSVVQGASTAHRAHGHDPWQDDPTPTRWSFDSGGRWSLLDPASGPVRVQGRLVGGCIETVSILAGTSYGDLPAFARAHAPEGLLVHVEASGDVATDIARDLWRMRLAGWFDDARAVLVGRTTAPDADGFTQLDAVRSVLGDLGLPVVLDVDCGHVPPHLALVNGALAELEVDGDVQRLTQTLV